jgi:DNA repair protein RecN (Recombination protein N)
MLNFPRAALAARTRARDGMPVLVQLSISHVVLIEALTLELHRGFNVLTGETGAGKSMLVDALNLVLGGRANPDVVRRGEREAEVEALFEVEPASRIVARLEAACIPCDGELVIRRVVQSEGRSRAFVNGRMCTAAQLAELAPDLCDIASQHESVTLTDPATHMHYLDAFGKLEAARDEVGALFDDLAVVLSKLEDLRAAERGRAEREDFLAFQLREMDEVDPKPGEEQELEHERARLRHAERLAEVTRRAADRLYDGDGAISDELARISSEIEKAAQIDGALGALSQVIEAARLELEEAGRALARYAERIERRPERLTEVEDRLFRLQKLLRKHGPTTVELVAHRSLLMKEREALENGEARIVALEAERDEKLEAAKSAARALSRKRRAAAERLAVAIGRELARLAMGRARVVVDVTPTGPSSEDVLAVDGARLTRNGIDRVEFLIAPNKGEEPRPLRRIASGGELSRSLLALKRVLAENGPAGLYVFDEVDAGIGGAVAEVIGHAIADVARHRQVLCITHLPQIAALADAHFVIEKSEAKGRTLAALRRVEDGPARIEELARMIGGVTVGHAARRAAEELLTARKS